MKKVQGFTLIELMIVVAIIAFLSMLSVPSFLKVLAKSKRAEAYVNLSSLATAQKAYWIENQKYTKILNGKNGLDWRPTANAYYSYGFSDGGNNESYFIGSLGTPSSYLSASKVEGSRFLVVAAGDISGSGKPDVIGVDETGKISIIVDGLQ